MKNLIKNIIIILLVFFVISGFLITQNIVVDCQANSFSFTRFYIRRMRRLFPALFATWLLTLLGGFLLFTWYIL